LNLNRNLNMLITAGVVLWGLSILLFNQNNEDELAIILVYPTFRTPPPMP